MDKAHYSWHGFPVLYLAAYLLLAVVAAAEFFAGPTPGLAWPTALLLLSFGLLLPVKSMLTATWQTHLYLAVQAAVVTAILVLQRDSLMLPMLFCLLAVVAPLGLPVRQAALWIGLFAVINTVDCSTSGSPHKNFLISLPYTIGYILMGILAYSLARAETAQRHSERLLEELQDTYQQLQAYAGRVEELAVAQERNRLAREMHDALGHRLTVAAVQLEGAERLIPTEPARAGRMVHTVHDEVVDTLAELRRAVATLRTPLDDDLSLPAALTRLATGFEEATGIKTDLMLPEALPVVPDSQRMALYRVAQEALTNINRHAQARQAWLELSLEEETLTLLVKDNGRGFSVDTVQSGFGLLGLRERADFLNGAVHITSKPGQGTQICFHLPLPPQSEALPSPAAPAKAHLWKLVCPLSAHKARAETPAPAAVQPKPL